ncbi:hypothetical protein STCU_07389 [Strigomonas culicis]|uniref:Uncharacterized protein n=1 Tax=Strigomonas culicis TaxID=28005 RepID=S9U583_9TRYP|nr:hypothetical protein STCU_07389 [Strigomonas culicis]|eukprot:EPY23934.1 hypothetical protein STCU_07389 [Strigomonas culicis]
MEARFQSSLEAAQQAKDAGNSALREGQLRSAAFQYKKVYLYLAEFLPPKLTPAYASGSQGADAGIPLDLLRKKEPRGSPFDGLRPESQQQMLYLYIVAMNNLAQAHLKIGRFREAALCATDVVRFCAWHRAHVATAPAGSVAEAEAKALLRRAAANVQLQCWAQVDEDLAQLAQRQVQDAAIDAIRGDVEKGRAAEKAKQKKMAQRMFS